MTQQRISDDELKELRGRIAAADWSQWDWLQIPNLAADLSDARALLAQKDAADAARADHSTHFEGCWRHHLGCAVARIEAQDAEIAALKAERPVGLAEKNGRLAP